MRHVRRASKLRRSEGSTWSRRRCGANRTNGRRGQRDVDGRDWIDGALGTDGCRWNRDVDGRDGARGGDGGDGRGCDGPCWSCRSCRSCGADGRNRIDGRLIDSDWTDGAGIAVGGGVVLAGRIDADDRLAERSDRVRDVSGCRKLPDPFERDRRIDGGVANHSDRHRRSEQWRSAVRRQCRRRFRGNGTDPD